MIRLDYRDTRPIYNQVFDAFCEQIRAGILQPGDRLPSVRELAVQLAINPNTIQRAYRELEQQGWIGSVAGKGSFVCAGGVEDSSLQRLWQQFDALVEQLRAAGATQQELQNRVRRVSFD